MSKISKEEFYNDAKSLRLAVDEADAEYFMNEIDKFNDSKPEGIDLSDVKPLTFVNEELVNVFSSREEELVSIEDLFKNVHDREGNYIKIPKVLK